MKEKKEKQIQQIIDQLAKRFSLDSKAAKDYLVGVQSLFILHKPSFKIIWGAITEENFTSLPSIFRMAELVRQNREKYPSKQTTHKVSFDTSKPLLQTTKRDRYDLLLGTPPTFSEPEKQDRDRPKLIRHSKNDNERVSPDKLPHCPHGVPKGKICAICDPDKFREATGVD